MVIRSFPQRYSFVCPLLLLVDAADKPSATKRHQKKEMQMKHKEDTTIQEERLDEVNETVEDWLEQQFEEVVDDLRCWIEMDLAEELHDRVSDALSQFEEITSRSAQTMAEEIGLEIDPVDLAPVLTEHVKGFQQDELWRFQVEIRNALMNARPDLIWR